MRQCKLHYFAILDSIESSDISNLNVNLCRLNGLVVFVSQCNSNLSNEANCSRIECHLSSIARPNAIGNSAIV